MTNIRPYPAPLAETIEISDPAQLPNAPLVSVYMLAYNHEQYIADAIEGVIAQECDFAIELIIGEDCSPDRTRDIVLDYQRRYPNLIRVLMSTVNIGGIANGTRCLLAACGEFVAICEGDDYWHHPRKLAIQVQALREHPRAQLIHTDYNHLVGNRVLRNAHRNRRTPYLAHGDAFVPLLYAMTVRSPTVMYRASVLNELLNAGHASTSWPFGDYPKALYAALAGPVLYIPVSTATYRRVEGSAMNQGRQRSLQMQCAGLECREVFMTLGGVSDEVKSSVLMHTHKILRVHSVFLGDRMRYHQELHWLLLNGQRLHITRRLLDSMLISSPILLRLFRAARRARRKFTVRFKYTRIV